MKKYGAYIRCGFLEGCAYRNNLITGMLANFIQTAVLYYVWKSIFIYQNTVAGYTWEMMRRYVFVAYLCNSTFTFGFEMQTAKRIIKGDIILDLLKPVSYREMQFFRMLGNAVTEFGITFVFIGILYLGANGLQDLSINKIILFLISFMLGQVIKFGIQYIFSMLCFYTDNAYGVSKAREVLTNFFSGAIIPLAMFPEIFQKAVKYLPFQGIVYIPCSIFIGTFSLSESMQKIILQIIWTLLLGIVGNFIWKKASSVISLYGG
ncbi:MAG: ABC transporter permease [Oliverpabstia sp.]